MWDDFVRNGDYRSEDGKAFDLPVTAQGPTYFRYTSPAVGEGAFRVALILDFGINHYGVGPPFARLAALTKNGPTLLSMGADELIQLAGVLLDEVDRRRKLDVTITAGAPASGTDLMRQTVDLVPHRLPITLPVDQLDRLVHALFEASDSLEIYGRTRSMRPRNPDT